LRPRVSLSQLENLRATDDLVLLEQLQRFDRRITNNPPKEVLQSVGDCAETVPLAIMDNLPGAELPQL
jgi:hypothetical protein